MKNIYPLLLLCLFSMSFHAQSISQEHYNSLSEDNKQLYAELLESNMLRNERISQYLNSNPDVSRAFQNDEGASLSMYDVINGRPVYRSTYNSQAGIATKTRDLQVGGSLGLDLDGTGMVVGVWDGGPAEPTHPEFADASGSNSRIINVENENTQGNIAFSDHGTHVMGTIGAKGVNTSAKGMATNVTIRSYNFNDDAIEMFVEVTGVNGIILSNHSYGIPSESVDPWFMGAYTNGAKEIDDLARNNPKYLMVASAGNSGNFTYSGGLAPGMDKLTGDKTAKNNLVVANANASFDLFTGEYNIDISTSSSQGPTDDFRVKPDITAVGTGVFSTVPGGYATLSGTSMSSPNTTGTIVLLQQYYEQLHGEFMNSSTLKGIVCHTASDDTDIPGPDHRFGWGFLDANAAAQLITNDMSSQAIIDELTLLNGQIYTTTFSAVEGEKLSATISWTDISGQVVSNDLNNPSPRLVNDLDIRMTKDGVTYLPYKMEFGGVFGIVNTKADNTTDNIERIDIDAPETGTYTLTVSHKGILETTPFNPLQQDFALIVSGKNLSLGVEDEAAVFNSKIWPNPTNDILNLTLEPKSNENIKLSMIDLQGRVVFNSNIDIFNAQITETIDISNLANGTYILTIKQGNLMSNLKVVKD